MDYDIIIVGGGPAGLFAAIHLVENSSLKVLMIEKGKKPSSRKCPNHNIQECIQCEPCNILSGIGGAGLYSDGKLNFIPTLGKTDLTQFMSKPEAQNLIDETEEIFTRFKMDGSVYPPNMQEAYDIRKNAKKHGINLLLIKQKHLGSDNLPRYIADIADYIESKGLTIHTSEEVQNITTKNNKITGVITNKDEYKTNNVILAPGRIGANWVAKLAQKHGISLSQRGIEVGVRVEVHNDIMADLCKIIYDPTFFVQTSKYDDQTRTFCTNYGGFISLENYKDFVCVNGHAYSNKKSNNTNFAFLSKVVFTAPVTNNQAYGESIGKLATIVGGGKPILQRFGDLKQGRRSTQNRIKKGYIEPSMKNVVCGDIAMALPERILSNIIEGLNKLNLVIPGVANDETLLYAPEIKFFSTQIETDNNLETLIKGMYVAGDGPGVAGNIVSAAATGLLAAKKILKRASGA
ncbi:MAG: FAD-dependent oxidoreductase [Desulfobacteraceae bacterium 4572_130]|nr:MAG: FAD-dependent oxidoreductase [Desulfobacteraceae bacterium 4572_130]